MILEVYSTAMAISIGNMMLNQAETTKPLDFGATLFSVKLILGVPLAKKGFDLLIVRLGRVGKLLVAHLGNIPLTP